MNKLTLIIGLIFISAVAKAQGLERIIVEKYYVSDTNDAKASSGGYLAPGSVTYRLFVDLRPAYSLQAVYGVPGHELKIATTTTFFNNEVEGNYKSNEIDVKALRKNTVMLDSWLSVGAAGENHFGILKTEDTSMVGKNIDGLLQNNDLAAGIPIKERDGNVMQRLQPVVATFGIDTLANTLFGNKNIKENGQTFSTTNGSWASFGGSIGRTPSNRILIGQFTTTGIFSFELNLQIGTPHGGIENYVAKDPMGKEILFSALTYPQKKNTPPQINIIAPSLIKNFKENESVSIDASANDPDGNVTLVEFFANGKKIGEDDSAPFQFQWKASTKGKVKLTTTATDDLGGKTNSAAVKILVK